MYLDIDAKFPVLFNIENEQLIPCPVKSGYNDSVWGKVIFSKTIISGNPNDIVCSVCQPLYLLLTHISYAIIAIC